MGESLTVLGNKDLSSMMFEHILSVAGPLLEQAREQKSHIRTADDLLARQKHVKETFTQLLGGFPERTPLNARRVGTLQRDGYRIEKILFESRPQFHVTANLYLPDNRFEPAPAILVPCGHAREAKAYPEYQTLAQGLVKHGFVALVYDPLGQGERSQYWDEVKNDSRIGMCCYEHEYAGDQSLLIGRNLASYRIWDGMRAIDYLCERDEVDTSRIGCTGCSGGGTLTTYLFALDDRITAAMPVCYVTSREAWLATGMIADAEQVQDRAIELGIDHSDLCFAGAPRALRIGATDHDFFPVEGTRKTFDEVKRMYALLDAEDRVDLCVAEGEHGYLPKLREAAYQWFHLWLGNPGADPKEPAVRPEAAEDLWCAPGGQVSHMGSRTVFCFTRDAALALPPAPPALPTRGDAEDWQSETRTRLRELLRVPPNPGAAACDQHAAFFRGKVGIELLSFQSERGITIPALLFVPEKEGKWPGMVYVHEEGKEAEASHLGTIQMLASEGNVVLAIDVRGIGESQSADNISRDYKLMGVEGYHFYQYGMLGRSLVGGRVHDVLRSVALLIERPEVIRDEVSVVGEGLGGLLALFAGALDERIGTVFCSRSLASYRELATQEYYAYHPRWFVPGILKVCDLPEIGACVAPRRLILGGPLDHMRRRLTQPEAEAIYARTRAVYKLFDAEDALRISTDGT
jgi:cephalosporin-C deacetylase-like acetyl esterase